MDKYLELLEECIDKDELSIISNKLISNVVNDAFNLDDYIEILIYEDFIYIYKIINNITKFNQIIKENKEIEKKYYHLHNNYNQSDMAEDIDLTWNEENIKTMDIIFNTITDLALIWVKELNTNFK